MQLRRTTVALMAMLGLAVATGGPVGAEHDRDRDELDKHCPEHGGHPGKVADPVPGSAHGLVVDGADVWLHVGEDARSVQFSADEAGEVPSEVEFCIKAGDRAGGIETAHEGHVAWETKGAATAKDKGKQKDKDPKRPGIGYVVVYGAVPVTAEFFTAWDGDAGTVQRSHPALLGVPTPLDVDEVDGPDLVGTITLDGDDLTVQVDRPPGADPLPVSVEAVLHDSADRELGRDRLAVGYDARHDAAPDSFELAMPLGALTAPGSGTPIEIVQDGRGEAVALVGALFDGTAGDRQGPVDDLRLDLALSPEHASVLVAFDGGLEVGLTTDRPGPAVLERRNATGTASLTVENLPSSLALSLGPADTLEWHASGPVDELALEVSAMEPVVAGFDHVQLAGDVVPAMVTAVLGGTGLSVDANDFVGQLRVAAGDGPVVLPARSVGDAPALDDLLRLRDRPGEQEVGARLSGFRSAGFELDPMAISLLSDPAGSRPIDIDAAVDAGGGDDTLVDALVRKPHSSTDITVSVEPDGSLHLDFDNSSNMERFELSATNLSGVESVALALDNVSRKLSICMDGDGGACQRPNPHSVQRHPAVASFDFDDFGTHGAGIGPAFRTTLNAVVDLGSADPIEITNLRFRNLGFDVGEGATHTTSCGTIPRPHLFFDSRSHPFVINSFKSAGIADFRIGTDANPARAANRLSRVNSWSTAPIIGCLAGINRTNAGTMASGGQQVLMFRSGSGSVPPVINLNSFLGFQQVILDGGTVPNPQPW